MTTGGGFDHGRLGRSVGVRCRGAGGGCGRAVLHRIEHTTALAAAMAGGIFEKEHRLPAAAKLNALMHAGKEACAPERGACAAGWAGEHHDIRGQIAVFAAEAVSDPRAHAGPAALAEASV